MKILQNEINGTQTSFSTNFGGKLSFILSFLFPERLHCCYIYFHCSYLYNNYNYSLERCALSFIISFWDLIEFPYFAETTQRGDKGGWKQAQRLRTGWRQGDFRDDSNVQVLDVWVNIFKSFWRNNKHKVFGWDFVTTHPKQKVIHMYEVMNQVFI